MYLTYEEYTKMGGSIMELLVFERLEYKARTRLDTVTFGRIATVTEPVKRCMYELIGLVDKQEQSDSPVTSVSNDGYSISYAQPVAEYIDSCTQAMINDYLSCEVDDQGTPLLYRGVD